MSPTTDPTLQAPAAEAFDVGQYLRIALKYRWLILGAAALVVLLTGLWTLRQPKIYEAVCTLRYDPNPPRPLGSAVEEVASTVPSYWASREFYRTQNQIIASRAVTELVVTKLGLHKDADFFSVPKGERSTWQGASVELAAQKLQARTRVDQIKETQLVLIQVQDTSPDRARLLANAVADAYIEKTMADRLESTGSALKWLSSQLGNLRTQLESSEDDLHKFKTDNNVLSLSLEDRQNNVANDISRYSLALSDARTRRVQLESRLTALRAMDKTDPLKVHAAAVSQSTSITGLRETYRTKLSERDALAVKYGANHPEMRKLDAELAHLKTEIGDEVDALIGAVAIELKEVQQSEAGFQKLLDKANSEGLELNSKQTSYERLNRNRDTNDKLYRLVLERTAETDLTQALKVSPIKIIDRALRPTHHVSPRMTLNITLGLFGGLILGVLLAFLAAQFDRTVKSVEDVEALGLSVLGVLPRSAGESPRAGAYGPQRTQGPIENLDLVVHTHPMSAIAESCRSIRTNLAFMSPEKPLRALVVTSAFPQDGKTTVAVSVAIALAQSGKRVLIVDTDLRKPRIHRIFNLPRGAGVSSVLVGEAKLADVVQSTEVPGLWVVPCGPIPPNPSELLHSSRFDALVDETLEKFDRVIFDSPPVTVVTDAAVIAPQVHGTVIVARAQKTTRDALRSVLRQLRGVAAHVVGGVLNDLDPEHREYGYGKKYYYRRYGYYYGTGPEEQASDESKPVRAAG